MRRKRKILPWAGVPCALASIGRRCCAASCARCCWRQRAPALRHVPDGRDRRGIPRSTRIALAEARRVRPAPERLEIGTMLEVPALMWQLDELLREVDFVSVGSNDLLQFLFAADRGSPALYGRYDLLSQPVLSLLDQLLTAARAAKGGAGVPVSLCGEAASRPLEAMTLVGLGLKTLSMPATRHPAGEGIACPTRPRQVSPSINFYPSQCVGSCKLA